MPAAAVSVRADANVTVVPDGAPLTVVHCHADLVAVCNIRGRHNRYGSAETGIGKQCRVVVALPGRGHVIGRAIGTVVGCCTPNNVGGLSDLKEKNGFFLGPDVQARPVPRLDHRIHGVGRIGYRLGVRRLTSRECTNNAQGS